MPPSVNATLPALFSANSSLQLLMLRLQFCTLGNCRGSRKGCHSRKEGKFHQAKGSQKIGCYWPRNLARSVQALQISTTRTCAITAETRSIYTHTHYTLCIYIPSRPWNVVFYAYPQKVRSAQALHKRKLHCTHVHQAFGVVGAFTVHTAVWGGACRAQVLTQWATWLTLPCVFKYGVTVFAAHIDMNPHNTLSNIISALPGSETNMNIWNQLWIDWARKA